MHGNNCVRSRQLPITQSQAKLCVWLLQCRERQRERVPQACQFTTWKQGEKRQGHIHAHHFQWSYIFPCYKMGQFLFQNLTRIAFPVWDEVNKQTKKKLKRIRNHLIEKRSREFPKIQILLCSVFWKIFLRKTLIIICFNKNNLHCSTVSLQNEYKE